MVPFALSIAGSDPSGGAGIQADLKVFERHGVEGGAVIATLTVQNAQRCARAVAVDAQLVGEQLDAVLDDIAPSAVKTGALGSAANIEAVAARLAARTCPLVVDPVRAATHGATLLEGEGQRALIMRLLPHATLVTPNASEAEWLTGRSVRTVADAKDAARALLDTGVHAVLIKGGHLIDAAAIDVLCERDALHVLEGERLPDRAVHGLGCALSASITARLALGHALVDACSGAKRWLSEALVRTPSSLRRTALAIGARTDAPIEVWNGSNSKHRPQ
jgi:hydroxymethylpyrimidine/phosphomethylpyrimidine kinase